MRNATAVAKPPKSFDSAKVKVFQTYIHPEIKKRLKIMAIESDMTLHAKLHAILCDAVDRPDLIDAELNI